MKPSFNLVDREWIPCIAPDGKVCHLGLMDTLANAHQYKEICDESPLVTISLHRLLLAILHRVFGPATMKEWARLWKEGEGNFDRKKLDSYLKSKQIHSRFDLFDEEHPFYQTATLPLGPIDPKNMDRPKYVKPIWQMAHELAYSDSMKLFAHFKGGNWESRSAGEAARWLVAFQGFALAGLITTEEGRRAQDGSADGGQLVKSAIVLAIGGNLFQTLMLNLVHYSEDDEAPFAFRANKDIAGWERDGGARAADRSFDGYIDLLTWQSRRVKLVPDPATEGDKIGVSGVVAMKGWQLPGFERSTRETMVGFVKPEKVPNGQDPWPPLGFRTGKELWRDSHALFQSVAEKSERPKILSNLDDLRQEGHLNWKFVRLDVFGMSADRAKIFYWRHESLPLPLAYLGDPALVERLQAALKIAEDVASVALRPAVWGTAANRLSGNSGMKPDTDRVRAMVDSFAPDRLYWSVLELPYRELLVSLSEPDANRESLIQNWFFDTLRPAAIDAFDNSIGRIDGGRDLKAATIGRGMLLRSLSKVQADHRIPNREKKEGAA